VIEKHTCWAQIALSALIIGGYVAIHIASALGFTNWPEATKFDELVLLVAFFWFQRQRQSSKEIP
jgi:hypothetical protein